jgi:prefoldin subunit 5
VARAGENIAAIQKQLEDLKAEFDTEIAAIENKIDPSKETFETISVRPKKSDILIQLVTLVWAPYWLDAQGMVTPAW